MTSSTVQGNIYVSFPLAFLPTLSIVTNELYMILNQHSVHSIGIKTIFYTLLTALLIWMLIRRIKWRKQNIAEQLDLQMILGRTWFPALALGLSLIHI